MSTIYLKQFILPIENEQDIIQEKLWANAGPYGYIDNSYPCGLFKEKQLKEINFATTTIFYGGNGSGKSTLLNLIAEKLRLKRISPFNTSETFYLYANRCQYSMGVDDEGFPHKIPNGSRIITSDDIFDYMLSLRTNNSDISENKEYAKKDYDRLKYGETIKFRGLDDYEAVRMQILARRKSLTRRQFIRKTAGTEITPNSNGETALAYFESHLKNDRIYCLDEPENSLSPKMQLKLVQSLEEMAHYCGCQFIIATHSPFLLALNQAKIYDLDANPVTTKNWWELENTRTYFDFFNKHRYRFEQH